MLVVNCHKASDLFRYHIRTMPRVAKSTKTEILDAYNEVLQKLEDTNPSSVTLVQTRLGEESIAKAAAQSKNNLVQGIAALKVDIAQQLAALEKKLVDEKERLEELTQARGLEEKRLKDLYEITAKANTLEAFIIATREKKEALEEAYQKEEHNLEQAIAERKERWEKEQKACVERQKEEQEQRKKTQQREEEAYACKVKTRRQKEEDHHAYEKAQLERALKEKKSSVERELAARKEKVLTQEEELQTLRKFKEEAATHLQKEVTKAKDDVTKSLTFKHDYATKLREKETTGKVDLLNQRIKLLEEKFSDKQKSYDDILKRMELAQRQSQELAKRIVESASHPDRFNLNKEIEEQKRNKEKSNT